MANNYSVKVEADISNYNANIDSAADATKKFQDAAEDANKAVEDIGKVGAKSTKELLNEMRNLEKGGRSVSNYRKQLSKLQRDISDLTINYRAMSDEMKNSDLGRETVIRLAELQKEAAQYKDAIGDAQQAIRQLSSDTFAFDAAAQGIDLMSSALQTYISLGFNSADTTEKLAKVLGKLKTAEQGAATAIKVLNMLNKDTGVIMQAIGNIQLAAATKAAKLAKATNKATIAQKAFNLVAKANPYVLLASAIAALVIGIGAYVAVTNRSTTAAQDAARATENFKKALEEGKKEANETIAKFMILQSTWRQLKTEAEKTQWIKDNQDAFKELGLNIKDVNDAEKAFVKYSTNIIRAMALRAQAAKMNAELVKEYQKALDKADKMSQDYNSTSGPYSFGTKKEWEKAGLIAGQDYKTGFIQGAAQYGQGTQTYEYLTESGKQKMEEYAKKKGEAYISSFEEGMQGSIDKMNSLLDEATKLENPLGSVKDGANGVEDAIKAAEGSLTAANQKLSEMKTKFEAMAETDPGFDKMKQDVIEQEKLVNRLQKKYETIQKGGKQTEQNISRLSQLREELASLNKVENKLVEGTEEWKNHYKRVAEIEKEVKNLEGAIESYKKRINSEPLELISVDSKIELPKFVTSTAVLDLQKKMQDAIAEANRQFKAGLIDNATLDEKIKEIEDRFNKAKLEIEAGIRIKPLSNEDKRTLYDAKAEAASIIQKDFDLGLISPQQAKAMIDNLNVELKKAGIKAEVGIDFHLDSGDATSQISSLVAQFDKISGIGNGIVGPMNDIYESVGSLNDRLSEAEDGWQSFFAVFQTGMTVFQSFTTILETFESVMEIVNTVKAAMIATTEADTQATKRNTQEKIKNAGATAAEAIASGTNSAAGIPMVGWAIALAAGAALLAMLMGAMRTAKGFAGGGIVGGNSFHGDKILTRLNSNEMVLNPKQQANLFKMLDSGRVDNSQKGEVEFKINGTQLVGVLNNYNKKMNKI